MPRPFDLLPTTVTDSGDAWAAANDPQRGTQGYASTRGDQHPDATVSSRSGSLFADNPVGDQSPLDHDLSQRFERHGLLGRGGFGMVYRAYDRKLARFVAVKVPHRGLLDEVSNRRRVEREAAATARLRHPHIVTLHDFVTCGDQSLLINELVEGETLAQMLDRFPNGCDLRIAATIVQRIAQAVQHAHDQNVLHRDIKPSNILLDTTVVDGELAFCPRLTDFGVARIIRNDGATETHSQFIGTWHYTPPELLSHSADGHTRASDIYSLGIVLYELLTGRRPFAGTTLGELYPQIRNGHFTSPRVLRAEVPRDLEAICLRCMATSPGIRYASAGELAADLSRFLNGDSVVARLPGTIERVLRWTRRRPTQAATIAISAISVTVVVFAVALMNRQLSKVNADLLASNLERESIIQAGLRTLYNYEQTIYAGEMFKASTAIQEMRLRNARTILATYADGQPLAHHRDVEWEHARFQISRESTILWKADQALYCIAQSDRQRAIGGAASRVALLDRVSGDAVHQWQTEQTEVNSIVLDPEVERLWCSGDDGTVHAYDTRTGAKLYRAQVFEDARAYDLVHFPELQQLICFSSEGTIAAIDSSTGEIRRRWPAHKEGARSIASAGPRHFAVGHAAGLLHIYNVATGKVQHELKLEDYQTILALTLDPEAHRLWVMAGNSIRYLDLETTTFAKPWTATDELTAMACDSVNQSVVVSMEGGVFQRLRIADDGELTPVDQWANEGQRVFTIATDLGSGEILSADAEGALRKWHSAPLVRTEHRGPSKSKSIQFDFISGGDLESWPALVSVNRTQVFSLATQTGQRQAIAYDGPPAMYVSTIAKNQLLIGSSQPPAQLLDLTSGTVSEVPVHASDSVNRSDDGAWLCGVEPKGGHAWLLDAVGLAAPLHLPAHHSQSIAVAPEHGRVFWNDGNALMSRLIATADAPQHHVTFSRVPKFLELSNDQWLIAVGLTDREVHLWDWQQDRRIGPVLMHSGRLQAMAFSQGGRTLMTLDEAAVLRFWNVKTSQLMLEKQLEFELSGDITQARFSPDGRFLVTLYDRQNFNTLRLY